MRADRGTETVDVYRFHHALHAVSPTGEPDDCWRYGRSVHNQKIEAFWSQMKREWEISWQDTFRGLESEELWEYGNPLDQSLLYFVYMPILRQELEQFRREYNIFPMRYNPVSRLPWGPPEDNFILCEIDRDFGVTVDAAYIDHIRETYLDGFDAEAYISEEEMEEYEDLLLRSPWGQEIDSSNARSQYCYLREALA